VGKSPAPSKQTGARMVQQGKQAKTFRHSMNKFCPLGRTAHKDNLCAQMLNRWTLKQ
jgi:hypothetical protein